MGLLQDAFSARATLPIHRSAGNGYRVPRLRHVESIADLERWQMLIEDGAPAQGVIPKYALVELIKWGQQRPNIEAQMKLHGLEGCITQRRASPPSRLTWS